MRELTERFLSGVRTLEGGKVEIIMEPRGFKVCSTHDMGFEIVRLAEALAANLKRKNVA